jgi:hypothetical protein|tara:strand:- start:1398 stop:1610 length:213 start_codon:yes stop_codon:yes gene_type:complete
MSVIWIRDKYFKELKQRQEDITNTLLSGVKSFDQYQHLLGRYSSLVEAENLFRELLGKVIQDDEEQSNSS